jgi:DNA polymerase III epsilon subunit-like protein
MKQIAGRKKPIRHWSCCSLPFYKPGCERAGRHVFRIEDYAELHALYSFISSNAPVDGGSSNKKYQKAIALDCEMAYTDGGLEVVSLSIISLPTGTVLHNSLVEPDFDLIDDNFRFSGVKEADILHAKQAGTCLPGIHGARARVLEFVNKDTIIVGHGLDHDLKKLRLVHDRIIDTAIVYSEPGQKTLSLKGLAKAYLGLEIQADTANRGHSSTEDAIIAMNLCLQRADWPTILPIGFGHPQVGRGIINEPYMPPAGTESRNLSQQAAQQLARLPLGTGYIEFNPQTTGLALQAHIIPQQTLPETANEQSGRGLWKKPVPFVKAGQRPARQEAPTKKSYYVDSDFERDFSSLGILDSDDWSLCDKDCGWCGRCNT